jgi:ribonuclease E
VGRISQFGLLEFSRQRLRPSLLESHSQTCSHCHGTGLVRSVDSLALQTLREIERTIIAGNAYEILVTVPMGVDLFLLNQKRNAIVAIENRYGVIIQVIHNATMISPIFVVEVKSERPRVLKIKTEQTLDQDQLQPSTDEDDSDDSIDDEDNADTPNDLSEKDEAPFVKKKSKRNNNRRRRNGRKTNPDAAVTVASSDDAPHDAPEADQPKPKIASPKATETDQSENNPTDGQLDKRFNNNNNRRRRHPYQRRQHNKPFESNQGENGAGESRSNETSSDASSVVPIRGSSKQQAPRKQESQDSNDGRVASVDSAPGKKEGKKQSKGWLRRLLDS